MVPLCYRSTTVNGLKNPACILHAPYCDVQDANEMRTVEDAARSGARVADWTLMIYNGPFKRKLIKKK